MKRNFVACAIGVIGLISSSNALCQTVNLPCERLAGDLQRAYVYLEAVSPAGSDYDTPAPVEHAQLAYKSGLALVSSADIDVETQATCGASSNASVGQETYAPHINSYGTVIGMVGASNDAYYGTGIASSHSTARSTFEIEPHPSVGTEGYYGADVTVDGFFYLTVYGGTIGPEPPSWLAGDVTVELETDAGLSYLVAENLTTSAGWAIDGELLTSSKEDPDSEPVTVEEYLTDELNDFYYFSSVAKIDDGIRMLSDVNLDIEAEREPYGSDCNLDWAYSMLVYCSVIDQQI